MYNIIVYENKRFGNIRTFVEEGKQEPWFVAADVCRALEVKNARDAVARLDDDEKNTVVLTDGNRGNPNVIVWICECDICGQAHYRGKNGETWRCWMRKPTEKEMANAPWEEKS